MQNKTAGGKIQPPAVMLLYVYLSFGNDCIAVFIFS